MNTVEIYLLLGSKAKGNQKERNIRKMGYTDLFKLIQPYEFCARVGRMSEVDNLKSTKHQRRLNCGSTTSFKNKPVRYGYETL